MRLQLAGGSVRRLVEVWRDSDPLPGERQPKRIVVDHYGLGMSPPVTVASAPHGHTGRWQRFLVNAGPEGDRLLAALKLGPVKPAMSGDAWKVDLDYIKR
ncbi:MAG TPA: hypothetical protein VLB85_03965 [Acidimicrobiia bacterium]|nr:hypothetical protein [Acidimicrobiia bacterium]